MPEDKEQHEVVTTTTTKTHDIMPNEEDTTQKEANAETMILLNVLKH